MDKSTVGPTAIDVEVERRAFDIIPQLPQDPAEARSVLSYAREVIRVAAPLSRDDQRLALSLIGVMLNGQSDIGAVFDRAIAIWDGSFGG